MKFAKKTPNARRVISPSSPVLLLLPTIIISLLVISHKNSLELIGNTHWVKHTFEVMTNLTDIRSDMKDLETGQRGYLITGEDRYLTPYNDSLLALDGDIEDVRQLIKDNPTQQKRLDILEPLSKKRKEFAEHTIELRRTQGFDAAKALILTGEGKRITDDIQKLIKEMLTEETGSLDKRSKYQRKSIRNMDIIRVSGISIVFLFAIIIIALIYRTNAIKNLEQKRSEERFRLVVEAAPNGMIMMGREGKMTLVNSQTEKLFGYSREELMGQKIEMLVPERYRSKHPGHRDSFFADPKTRSMGAGRDLFGQRKDGSEVPIEIGLNPIETPEGMFVLASIIDITERKRAEAQQAHLLREVAGANRELTDFAYVVSHDLKAPLRGIISLSEWIVNDYQEKIDAEGKKQLQLMHEKVMRMQELIDGILQYSAVGRVREERGSIDLNPLLKEVVGAITPPGHVRIEIQEKLPWIAVDKTRMHQVFQNLLQNAVKFIDKPEGKIQVSCAEDGPHWRFSVADNGRGIEERYHSKIFKLFETLGMGGKSEGTGIGLALVKKIIETHGGKIWVESKVGQSSTFFFTLPKSLN